MLANYDQGSDPSGDGEKTVSNLEQATDMVVWTTGIQVEAEANSQDDRNRRLELETAYHRAVANFGLKLNTSTLAEVHCRRVVNPERSR